MKVLSVEPKRGKVTVELSFPDGRRETHTLRVEDELVLSFDISFNGSDLESLTRLVVTK